VGDAVDDAALHAAVELADAALDLFALGLDRRDGGDTERGDEALGRRCDTERADLGPLVRQRPRRRERGLGLRAAVIADADGPQPGL
jgi:hypothetical protein